MPKTEEKPEPVKAGVYVADGCSVLCKTGIADAGEAVKPQQFAGGQETVEKLVKSGHLVKR